jgi:RNA polymerase sigma-70 factor (ECF subfamily)
MSREETLLGLLSAYGGALRRIARTYAGARGEAEDLHQEILLQLWRGLASFRGDSAPGTWLYRVALNTALTWRRRSDRDARADSALGRLPGETAGVPRSEAAILDELLASLGPIDRSVLLLYLEGLSYHEIGEVTGLSASAVGVRIHRTRKSNEDRYLKG